MIHRLCQVLTFLLLFASLAAMGNAQDLLDGDPGGDPGEFSPSGASGASSILGSPLLGPVDFSATLNQDGFGYEGHYVSAQTVTPIFFEANGAWWVLDFRGNVSENGGIFTNLGVLRRTHFPQMNADFGIGAYWDYDGDEYEIFGHDFHQAGVHAHLYTQTFDIEANGYIPLGQTGHFLGTQGNCFQGNQIMVGGVDAALEGFDITGTVRVPTLNAINGRVSLGGFGYRQREVASIGGFLGSFAFQPRPGMTITTGLQASDATNDTVDTTGFVTVALNLGGSRGYSPTGQGLRAPTRKAHITRIHSDPFVLNDPVTGAPYSVVHVDNSAPAGGTGTFEAPVNTLTEAQAAMLADGTPGTILFVREGGAAYSNPIMLEARAQLLGDGVRHVLPGQNNINFALCNDIVGGRPVINNTITMTGDNTIRGFVMNPGGVAIQTAMAGNVNAASVIDQVNVNSGTQGLLIRGDAGGTYTVTNTNISGTTTDALAVFDGTGTLNVDFQGNIGIAGAPITAGQAVNIANTVNGSQVNVTNGSIISTGGAIGINVDGVDGQVNITSPQQFTNQQGVVVTGLGATGSVNISDTTIVNNAGAIGPFSVAVTANTAGSTTTLNNLSINNTNGTPGMNVTGAGTTSVTGNSSIMTSGNTAASNSALAVAGTGTFNGVFTTISYAGVAANANDAVIVGGTVGGSLTATNVNITGAGGLGGADGFDIQTNGTFVTNVNTATITSLGSLGGHAVDIGSGAGLGAGSSTTFGTLNATSGVDGNAINVNNGQTFIVNNGTANAAGGSSLFLTGATTTATVNLTTATSTGGVSGINVTGLNPAGGNSITIGTANVTGPTSNGILVTGYLGNFVVSGGTIMGITGANNAVQIANAGNAANFTFNGVTANLTGAGAGNNIAFNINSGTGNFQLQNNIITFGDAADTAFALTGVATTMMVNSSGAANNNTTTNFMGGNTRLAPPGVLNPGGGGPITGQITIDSMLFDP